LPQERIAPSGKESVALARYIGYRVIPVIMSGALPVIASCDVYFHYLFLRHDAPPAMRLTGIYSPARSLW